MIINEKLFENHVRQIIADEIVSSAPDLVMMEFKKAVDILVCRNGSDPALFFIEIKFHQKHHGRLGFGSASGIGFQPEVLRRNPDYFSQNMRWVIGDEDNGFHRFLLLTNSEMISFVAGGSVGEKFNNIQMRIFRESKWLTKEEFVEELSKWMR